VVPICGLLGEDLPALSEITETDCWYLFAPFFL
jgi:hypothetical protein